MDKPYHTLRWEGDATGSLHLVDQTLLPAEFREIVCRNPGEVHEAICSLRVRGAPAIGVAAGYGLVLGCSGHRHGSPEELLARVRTVAADLAGSRPTAVNLFRAIERVSTAAVAAARQRAVDSARIHDAMFAEAQAIEHEDQEMCRAIGRHGSGLLESGMSVLTHCNAGALATAGDGTALSVIFSAVAEGKSLHVFADETRPLLQGARLTAWELQRRGIPVTVICDNMAAQVMKEGRVQLVITGADRIAANGDSANKIGTYGLAVLARFHGIPFCIAAPSSTFDFALSDGDGIPIEQRSPREITHGFGRQTVADGTGVYNPAFDVTPASLINAIVTERGVIRNPCTESVRAHFA